MTQPKEHPILFSAPMVRALLVGEKTQTRRVVKPQPEWTEPETVWQYGDGHTGPGWYAHNGDYPEEGALHYRCPYGQPGDRLWVRETFYCDNAFYPDGVGVSCMWREVDGQRVAVPVEEQRARMLAEDMYYRADGDPDFEGAEGPTPWRPSIHMPRWASRMLLEVVSVRVERLQDISIEDAKAEGAWPDESIVQQVMDHFGIDAFDVNPRKAYRMLWEQINGPGSWDANPWVWVVTFRVLKP